MGTRNFVFINDPDYGEKLQHLCIKTQIFYSISSIKIHLWKRNFVEKQKLIVLDHIILTSW